MSHDPSEISLIFWFAAQETFLINDENSLAASFFFFVETMIDFILQDSLMNRKFKGTAFVWNIYIFNIINVFAVNFDQFNVLLLNKIINSYKKSYPKC